MIVTVITMDILVQYQHEVVDTNARNAGIKALVESNVHILRKQKGILFQCNKCEYKANTKGSSAVHINRRHKN